ncbi:MAG: hypothetical protein R3E46_04215 [Sedimenticolaceae bacterium]
MADIRAPSLPGYNKNTFLKSFQEGFETGTKMREAREKREGREAFAEAMQPQETAIPAMETSEQQAMLSEQAADFTDEQGLSPSEERAVQPVQDDAWKNFNHSEKRLAEAYRKSAINRQDWLAARQEIDLQRHRITMTNLDKAREAWARGDPETAAQAIRAAYRTVPDSIELATQVVAPDKIMALPFDRETGERPPNSAPFLVTPQTFQKVYQRYQDPKLWLTLYGNASPSKELAELYKLDTAMHRDQAQAGLAEAQRAQTEQMAGPRVETERAKAGAYGALQQQREAAAEKYRRAPAADEPSFLDRTREHSGRMDEWDRKWGATYDEALQDYNHLRLDPDADEAELQEAELRLARIPPPPSAPRLQQPQAAPGAAQTFAAQPPAPQARTPVQPQQSIPVGATATNPSTGEKVRWTGSAWEPVQ